MNRNLDGVYFRIERDGKWDNVCFSDLTSEEMDKVLEDRSVNWLRSLCKVLGETIKDIGNEYDICDESGND